METLWNRMIVFLNELNTGDITTRQEMMENLLTDKKDYRSMDVYRAYLTKAGYLETVAFGYYKLCAKIPNWTVEKVKKMAYEHN